MTAAVCAGFADPVHDAQRCFRAALQALARPARIETVGAPVAGISLDAALTHLLLTLTDEDTPVWWQQPDATLARWLRFHTGARSAMHAREAAFAVVQNAAALDRLDQLAAGTLTSPEQSCTLLIAVPSLHGGASMRAHGPGIAESESIAIPGLHERFWAQWQANHAAFPQGVDAFFTHGSSFIGLPRSTRISRLEEV
jgi:alpha-D-ribose 1-methylphosphonate 5-triphosphate synthase subunit PhnH